MLANHCRYCPILLPSASPHQNLRLLPRLPSFSTEYLLLCVRSITHYLFHLHLNFERANVITTNALLCSSALRVTRARCLLLRLSFPFVRSLPLPYACYSYHHRGYGPVYVLRYMTIRTEPSVQFTANHRRRSIKPLPGALPHQNLRLLPLL